VPLASTAGLHQASFRWCEDWTWVRPSRPSLERANDGVAGGTRSGCGLQGGDGLANALPQRHDRAPEGALELGRVHHERLLELIQHLSGFTDLRIEQAGQHHHAPPEPTHPGRLAQGLEHLGDEGPACHRWAARDVPDLAPGTGIRPESHQTAGKVGQVAERVRRIQ